ncbi:MAG: ATPase [Clostridiaceae bacterium]
MLKGKVRHMFPGGNTSKGFYSFYQYIISQEDAKRIFILKGGPGVGKSTFMKKIAARMLERGYDAEYMHCSSDNSSLDGIVIPKIGIAMIDGTAPHVVDFQIQLL